MFLRMYVRVCNSYFETVFCINITCDLLQIVVCRCSSKDDILFFLWILFFFFLMVHSVKCWCWCYYLVYEHRRSRHHHQHHHFMLSLWSNIHIIHTFVQWNVFILYQTRYWINKCLILKKNSFIHYFIRIFSKHFWDNNNKNDYALWSGQK